MFNAIKIALIVALLVIPVTACAKTHQTPQRLNVVSTDKPIKPVPCLSCSVCHDKSKCQVARTGRRIGIGHASWYGGRFHGRKTASGERFNKHAMTAAHKTLPMGTKVKVTNLKTQDSVVVTINDRGPFVRGRIIDLSQAAAQAIGINGVGSVELTRLN